MKPTTSELASSQWGRGERYIQHLRRERIKNWATTIAVGLAIAFFLWVFAPKAHGADAFTRPSESVRAGFLKLQPDQQNDMLPPVVPVVPVTNLYSILLAWDDPNGSGVVDHFKITLTPLRGGPVRVMTSTGTSNMIQNLSYTNRYSLRVQAVVDGGNESELSEELVWRPDVVSATTVSVVSGVDGGTFTNVPGASVAAAPGFYRVFVGPVVVLSHSAAMAGPWSNAPISTAHMMAMPIAAAGQVYKAGIVQTNNVASFIKYEHRQ